MFSLSLKPTRFSAPAFPLEDVYDPTGAGDTFAGGFFGYIAKQGGEHFGVQSPGAQSFFGTAMAFLHG